MAGAAGANMIEVDIRVTADGRPVVSHDATLQVGRHIEWIAEARLDELTGLSPEVAGAAEVFRAASAAGLGLYLDIKSMTAPSCRALHALLAANGLLGRAILASARPDLLAIGASVAPDLPRAILFYDEREDPLDLARSADAHFVHPCWERLEHPPEHLTEPWLARVRERRLGVVVWHEERRAVLDYLCGAGVDGICTDDPELLTGVVRSRPAEAKRVLR
jgi:glycerophosphoryl diester phosphodiesterase